MSPSKVVKEDLHKEENCTKCGNTWYFIDFSGKKKMCSMCGRKTESLPNGKNLTEASAGPA